MQKPENPFFSEVQRFPLWVRVLFFIPIAVILWQTVPGIYSQIVLGIPWGTKPISNNALLLVTAFLAALIFFFFIAALIPKMVTQVTEKGVFVRFYPFHLLGWKMFDKNIISTANSVTYNPLLDYGGWGIRFAFSKGWAYIVKGKKGVMIELSNSSKFLIGSQKPDQLSQAVSSLISQNNK